MTELDRLAPATGPVSRACSQCATYQVGPDNFWLCYRCGFDGPLPIDSLDSVDDHCLKE